MGKPVEIKTVIGIPDLTLNLIKALIAELIGTMLLTLFGCGSCTGFTGIGHKPSVVQISLAFGLIVASMVQAICHISGGHINPAVTASMLVTGKISIIKGLLYILVQCVGGITGAAILKGLTPVDDQGLLGLSTVNPAISGLQGFGMEFLITLVLILTVHGVCDGNRDDVKGSGPLAIGLAVAAGHLLAVRYTGAGMNPARTLGPAVLSNFWEYHWVYWAGPMGAGVVGGLLYLFVFRNIKKTDASYDF